MAETRKQDTKPFYWSNGGMTKESEGCYVAPTGWYQWTQSGLEYLGESILEQATEAQWRK